MSVVSWAIPLFAAFLADDNAWKEKFDAEGRPGLLDQPRGWPARQSAGRLLMGSATADR